MATTTKIIKSFDLIQKLGYGFDNGKPTLELIVADEMGNKIVINIRNSLKPKFDKLIKEWGHFCILYAAVIDSPVQYRTKHLQHEYKLMFIKKTIVVAFPAIEWTGTNGFTFTPFDVLINRELVVGVTADVIGRLSDFSPVFGVSGELKSKYINLQLTDLDGLQVDATLWSKFCMDFDNHIKLVADDASVILLIQFGVTKMHNSKLAVSSDWTYTNV
ncbi:uncharacterized protein [Rutidosis leptorrhynchoides]|uniref:uncharacterized protein n=1 Tax=Rutidosis leptorrhynchoides TaxID=125765 RepID=UPI003A99E67B